MKISKKSIHPKKAQEKIGKRLKICLGKIEKGIKKVREKIVKGTSQNLIAGQDVVQGLVAVLGAITVDLEGGQGELSGLDLEAVSPRDLAPKNEALQFLKARKSLHYAVFQTTMFLLQKIGELSKHAHQLQKHN